MEWFKIRYENINQMFEIAKIQNKFSKNRITII